MGEMPAEALGVAVREFVFDGGEDLLDLDQRGAALPDAAAFVVPVVVDAVVRGTDETLPDAEGVCRGSGPEAGVLEVREHRASMWRQAREIRDPDGIGGVSAQPVVDVGADLSWSPTRHGPFVW